MVGYGVYTFLNGCEYKGNFENGVFSGKGEYTMPGRWKYVGYYAGG